MLGFEHLSGVDLLPNLLKQYSGDARRYVTDFQSLRFEAESKDWITVQRGLHHLSLLPADLNKVLREATRILRRGDRIAIVVPWQPLLLRFVHVACQSNMLRRMWPKLDALATMIDCERPIYMQ